MAGQDMDKTIERVTGHKVLVIDDDPDILALVTTLLDQEGYRVYSAASGEECISIFNEEHPEVVLIDFMLPGMNGLEIIRLIRRIDMEVPAIAITGQGNEKLAVDIMKAGAFDYLSKPFEGNELLSSVRRALDAKHIKQSALYRDLASANIELKRSAKEKDIILCSLADGLLTTDGELRILSWNPAAESITGIGKADAVGRTMIDIFGEDFCAAERELLEKPVATSYSSLEATIENPGGLPRSITVIKSGGLLKDEQENIVGVVVTIRDISDRKELLKEWIDREKELNLARRELSRKEELAQSNELLRTKMQDQIAKLNEIATLNEVGKILTSQLELADVLNTIMTMAGRLFDAQSFSIRLLDVQAGKLNLAAHSGLSDEYLKRGPIPIGKSVAGTVVLQRKPLHVPDVLGYRGLFKVDAARREGLKSLLCFPLIIRDRCIGVMSFYHKTTHYYTDKEMRFLSTFSSTVSIAVDNAQLYERQKNLAVSDGLTKLFNYRYYQERLKEEVGRAKRYDLSLSVILLDIDHFKKYNDTYGHQAGDSLLQELSAILKSAARENDVVARYGGEEFIYLLQQANKKEAMLFAKRLRRRIADRPFEGESVLPDGMLTVSLGVASFPEDAEDAEELIHCADRALYEAKGSGRNLVRGYVPPRSGEL